MKYDTYHFSKKEMIILILMWIGISGVIAYFFYRSWIVFGIVLLCFPLFLKWQRKSAVRKRKWELTLGFREAVVIVAGNLQAGNSVENAFRRTYGDLKSLYGENADLIVFFFTLYMYNRSVMQNAAYRGTKQVFYYMNESNSDIKKECNKVILTDLENSLIGVEDVEVEIEVSANRVEVEISGRLNVPKMISSEGTVFEKLWDYKICAEEIRLNPAEIIRNGQNLENIIKEVSPDKEEDDGSQI